MAAEIGGGSALQRAGLLLGSEPIHRTPARGHGVKLHLGPKDQREMAQEVDLNSLQELEREVILQVLYRDRTVQNMEEERIRYAVSGSGGPLWASGFLLGVCALGSRLRARMPGRGGMT